MPLHQLTPCQVSIQVSTKPSMWLYRLPVPLQVEAALPVPLEELKQEKELPPAPEIGGLCATHVSYVSQRWSLESLLPGSSWLPLSLHCQLTNCPVFLCNWKKDAASLVLPSRRPL